MRTMRSGCNSRIERPLQMFLILRSALYNVRKLDTYTFILVNLNSLLPISIKFACNESHEIFNER